MTFLAICVLAETGLRPNKIGHAGDLLDEDLILQIRELARELGRTPTMQEFNECKDTVSVMTTLKHFGSWNAFLQEAGLAINREGRKGRN